MEKQIINLKSDFENDSIAGIIDRTLELTKDFSNNDPWRTLKRNAERAQDAIKNLEKQVERMNEKNR